MPAPAGGGSLDGDKPIQVCVPSNGWTDPFRKQYRELSEQEKSDLYRLKVRADELCRHFDLLPVGREKSLAMTNLEQAVMWATKALTG